MLDAVEAGLNALRMVPCPGCGERALRHPEGPSPLKVTCARCDARFDALAEVRVAGDEVRLKGTCCAGWRRHELAWREDAGDDAVRRLVFWTWAQDHVRLGAGDVASLLFADGDLSRRLRRGERLMPLIVADHTLRRAWALPGSVPLATLR